MDRSGAALLGGLLLSGGLARAEWRWPWEGPKATDITADAAVGARLIF